ncbi:hypothetical protein SELMODRAFT_409573 [Selaginella moellendorffii]|uniref:Protein kinase domain-containing protein n=1 Tax=Selaginella moellendorffii TaxID=88036 RepID=D8RBW1_SELML|nr:uncharacterized protein LOC9631495 [Selaginella moellendorffii]EFJ30856.1 hypothetical protein SELMODRAFT_409573 [Selaginella moellendorffii]|eukprot:XP_002968602.1 uncharacterized protein LOC9631495 [Selaginella moellendorffii]
MDGVVVKQQQGQVIERFEAPITVKVILEELRESGYRGHLIRESTQLRVPPPTVLVPGDVVVLVEKRPREPSWFDEHDGLPSASAFAKDVAEMKKQLGKHDPVYDLGRNSAPMPLVLAHEAFAGYVQALDSHRLDVKDWTFLSRMMAMSGYFDQDVDRQAELLQCWKLFFEQNWPGKFKLTSSREPDILIQALVGGEWITVGIVVVKNEVGLGGEPCVESLKHYGSHATSRMRDMHWSYWTSCLPVLILEVVGPTIRVGGAIFHDSPGYEPFTPYLHMLKFLQDDEYLTRLARAIVAFPPAIVSISAFYAALAPLQPTQAYTERAVEAWWPSLLIAEKQRHPGLEVSQFTRQVYQRTEKRLIFLLKYSTGEERLMKFSQRYGADVHKAWSDAGFAPTFTIQTLVNGWKAISMEYYSPNAGWIPLNRLEPGPFNREHALDPSSWENCRQAVVKAYQSIHELYPYHVHGDLRKRNILFNLNSLKVAFVDFDWAGTSGDVRYPIFLNPNINWPQGVQACHPILPVHDKELLKLDLN